LPCYPINRCRCLGQVLLLLHRQQQQLVTVAMVQRCRVLLCRS
jgi:hypothetical protein